MTTNLMTPCVACCMFFFSAVASAANADDTGLQQAWLVPALIALLVASALGLIALVVRRRRARALAAVLVKARARSMHRHTERQGLGTQFSEADF